MERHEPRGFTESTRRALEKAAHELIARDGLDNTTVAAIAAEAGFTERTFYRYFDEKEDVVFSPLEARFDLHLPNLRQCVLEDGLTVDSLLRAFRATCEQHPEHSQLILRSSELIRDNPDLERRLAYHGRLFTDRVTEAVAEILDQDVPDISVRVTVAVAIATVFAAFDHRRAGEEDVPFGVLLDEARRLLER